MKDAIKIKFGNNKEEADQAEWEWIGKLTGKDRERSEEEKNES